MLLTLLAIAGAVAPWWLLWRALGTGRRLCRPRLVRRHGQVPIEHPPSLAGGLLTILLSLTLFAGWLAYTHPLWATYATNAWDYRQRGAAEANLMAQAIEAAGFAPGPGQMTGAGYVVQPVAPGGGPFLASLAYYWRDTPGAAPPGAPVETVMASGSAGTYVLTYRRDLAPSDRAVLSQVLVRLRDSPELPPRRPAHDLPLLVRSVLAHWRGFAGVLDTAAGVARGIVGFGLLPPLYVVAAVIGGLPGP